MLRHALLKRTPVLPRLASRKAFVPLIQKRQYSDDVFLTTNAANYIDEMYAAWKDDPKSVHVSWQVSDRERTTTLMCFGMDWIGSDGLVGLFGSVELRHRACEGFGSGSEGCVRSVKGHGTSGLFGNLMNCIADTVSSAHR